MDREAITGIKEPTGNEIKYFHDFDAITLKQLIKAGFLDPKSTQNYSPTAEEFVAFMERYPQFKAHGYIVSLERDDARITVEGIHGTVNDLEEACSFANAFHYADEFIMMPRGYARVWWD